MAVTFLTNEDETRILGLTAPGGYGWGEAKAAAMPDGDANNALTTGLYRATDKTANTPADCRLVFTQAVSSGYIYQTAYCDSGIAWRENDHNSWGEWEWITQNVKYIPQKLTDEQKTQARTNIGAANGEWKLIASGEIAEDVVSYAVTKDNSGQAFSLNEVYISLVTKPSAQNDGNKGVQVFFNDRPGRECYEYQNAISTVYDLNCELYRYQIPGARNAIFIAARNGNTTMVSNTVGASVLNEIISSVNFAGKDGAYIGAGTSYQVWGKL